MWFKNSLIFFDSGVGEYVKQKKLKRGRNCGCFYIRVILKLKRAMRTNGSKSFAMSRSKFLKRLLWVRWLCKLFCKPLV
jgi:hypothetical protein